ncbi:MAG: hypothetical protein SF182_07295 [Deltaproteobacteria bacterium]|nr:hypothetical protein [Deltaproteobacteria bacterium]
MTIRQRTRAVLALLIGAALLGPAPSRAACSGDCNADHLVEVAELLLMVNVTLERRPLGDCPAGDADADGDIAVDDIVHGVNSALNGCSEPPATPTVAPCAPTPAATCAAACGLSGCCFAGGDVSCFDPAIQCTPSAAATCAPGWYGYTTCGNAAAYTQACQRTTPTPTPPSGGGTPTATATASAASASATPSPPLPSTTPSATPSSGAPSATPTTKPNPLYESIGIGADWGPHWSASSSAIDPRDNQDDAAFPVELCLLVNAGFQSIRLYGETVGTWTTVLQSIAAYNQGTLICAAGQGPPATPLAAVYQVAICGPDPTTMPWNGAVTAENIGDVKCLPQAGQMTPPSFVDSLAGEILKLQQVLQYAGSAFASTVKLVFVGNEILFSRGVCAASGAACTADGDCPGSTCAIAHYCSGTLGGAQAAAKPCVQQSDCSGAGDGQCTDVTNGAALVYAIDQVQAVLAAALGAGPVPPISISLQIDVMTGPTPGDPTTPLWSRQQLANALPGGVIAVNAYPDQWGKVLAGASVPPYPSCIVPGNAVDGTLDPSCSGDPAAYTNPVTNTLAHTIDTDYRLLQQYYPGFQFIFAETGWHTAGSCNEYNDSGVAPERYSPAAAATYLQDLYAYVASRRIPLLVFELFDQKTKTCTAPGPPAEANYGVLSNYCQVKDASASALPPNADLAAFDALLSSDMEGGLSCHYQALATVQGVGNTGVCANATGTACVDSTGCSGAACVWGRCAALPAQGCNPNDPNNPAGCGTCERGGNCYDPSAPSGYYASTTTPPPACWSNADCSSAACPFAGCQCYVGLAPATLPSGSVQEGPGLVVQYSTGSLTFEKGLGPLPVVQPVGDGTYQVQPFWDNVVLGPGWSIALYPPSGGSAGGTPSPCSNAVGMVTDTTITWSSPWSCTYPPSVGVGTFGNNLSLPRTFLSPVPNWPAP